MSFLQKSFGLLFLALSLCATPGLRACAECGGKGKEYWAAREREPKASQLFPNAPIVDYTLDIAETALDLAGRPVRALTLNGGVPGPTLRFHVGDVARIVVRNRLEKDETSLHWHGLLVPNLEDGVPHLTTPPLGPGQSRTFEFLLKHPGTYWYHSHTDLQEQRGVYGAIVVELAATTPPRVDLPAISRDEVVVLSDWTNEKAANVMRNLLRGSDWYAIRKGNAQSLLGAAQAGKLGTFLQRERARLPAMDVSDVAYDAFLANGRPTRDLPASPGSVVRLRFINAGASTYFYLSSATGPLTVIGADGNDVAPIQQKRLLIGMGETYDVLVTLPSAPGSWEVRATSFDHSGHASVFLGDGPAQAAPSPGAVDLYDMDSVMESVLDQMEDTAARTDEQALASEPARPLSPYARLRSTQKTAFPAAAPTRTLSLKLTGDMTRYFWSIDGKSIDEQSTIPVKKGEVLRLTLVNNTMMHHPMHLHGHFFRLLVPGVEDSEHAPLKHTVDVPPMSQRVIEFLANEDRDWLFHCHLLYHMKAGMARVLSYTAGEVAPTSADGSAKASPYQPALGDHAMPHLYGWVDGAILSQFGEARLTLQRGKDNANLSWRAGWARVERSEYEGEASVSHYINPRWTVLAGYRLVDRGHGRDAGFAGVATLLPYLVTLTSSVQSDGEIRITAGRRLPLTARLGLRANLEYDTLHHFSWSGGLDYTLNQQYSFLALFDSDYGAGAGVGFRF